MILNHPPKVKIENILLPLKISNNNKHLNVYTIFYVNVHASPHTKSGKVNIMSVQYHISRSAYTIITGLDIVKTLMSQGFLQ